MYSAPGYIPKAVWWKDLAYRILGNPNLSKRLQMPDIMKALDLKKDETALDFGCGVGYMTYEMAKRCDDVIGLDILDVTRNIIPKEFKGKLRFIQSRGENTPLDRRSVDVVLLSEVILDISEPSLFLKEVKRFLRPNGRIVIVNALDRQSILDDYEKNGALIRFARKYTRQCPETYDEFAAMLRKSFGSSSNHYFPDVGFYKDLLWKMGFRTDNIIFSPSKSALTLIERVQFLALCQGWKTYGASYFLLYPIAKLLDGLFPNPRGSGLIIKASLGERFASNKGCEK